MENYPSPEEALEDAYSFCLYCSDLDLRLNPAAYHVGDPPPPVTYATGEKGFLVDMHDTDTNRA